MTDSSRERADLPIGPPVDATRAGTPERVTLDGHGRQARARSTRQHTATRCSPVRVDWTTRPCGGYLFDGPYDDRAVFDQALRAKADSADPLHFAIIDVPSGTALGTAALMRIEPAHRVIEVGSIIYSPALQRTRGATEAMYLLARHVFETLGYRRYEWKCNALNAPSRRAARRLGFTFEGIFRQHMIMKGRNRDTAWFSMLDSEWPDWKAGSSGGSGRRTSTPPAVRSVRSRRIATPPNKPSGRSTKSPVDTTNVVSYTVRGTRRCPDKVFSTSSCTYCSRCCASKGRPTACRWCSRSRSGWAARLPRRPSSSPCSRLEKKGLVASRLDEPDGRARTPVFPPHDARPDRREGSPHGARTSLAGLGRRLPRTRPEWAGSCGCWSATPIAGRLTAISPSCTSSAAASGGEPRRARWLRRQRVLYPLDLMLEALRAAIYDRITTMNHLWRDTRYSIRSLARMPAAGGHDHATVGIALGATAAMVVSSGPS